MTRLTSIAIFCIACFGLSTLALAEKASKKKAQGFERVSAARKPALGAAYATREDVMRWADDMAERRDLDREWVRQAIGQSHYLPGVPRLMLPPPAGTAKNWRVYRSRFIDPIRIRAGVDFWQANRAALERAEKEYGVPAEIIVGIIGVETIYGQQMGSYRVLDALATLAFDFPASHPRARPAQEFFRGELEQFLSLAQPHRAGPVDARGQLRRRHGHAAVHAVQRGEVRRGLRRRRPDRPDGQPGRCHRLGGQLLQGIQLADRSADALPGAV